MGYFRSALTGRRAAGADVALRRMEDHLRRRILRHSREGVTDRSGGQRRARSAAAAAAEAAVVGLLNAAGDVVVGVRELVTGERNGGESDESDENDEQGVLDH